MFRRVSAVLFVLLSLSTLSAAPATAQPPASDRPQWSLGVAVISSPAPYVGADANLIVVPALSFSYKRFYLRGITAGYRFWESGGFHLDGLVQAQLAGYEADDSPFLAGMADRHSSVAGGFELAWEGERVGVSLTPTTDLLGNSNGQMVDLDVYFPIRFGPVRIEPRVGASWQSAEFVDYYAGVRAAEARPERPAYEGGSNVDLTTGLSVFSPVTRKILFQGFVRLDRLGDEIADSPIVDRRHAVTGFAALSYAF